MKKTPKEIDAIICEWSMKYGAALTGEQLGTLTAHVFNKLFADGLIHTVPNNGLHVEHKDCFCNPKFKLGSATETGRFIHFSQEEGH